MTVRSQVRVAALTALWLVSAATQASAADRWIGVWGFPPVLTTPAPRPATPAPVPVFPAPTITAAPPQVAAPTQNVTLRQELFSSTAAGAVRLRFSNEANTAPLVVGAAHLAILETDGSVRAGSDRTVTFSGATSTVLPASAPMLSDPIVLKLKPLERLALTAYFPGDAPRTGHRVMMMAVAGDATQAWPTSNPQRQRLAAPVTLIEATSTEASSVIVAFGDSITEGETNPAIYAAWPHRLAERLAANRTGRKFAVVNAGISGNRMLREGSGLSALARFDRDVLSVPGVTHVILLEGINDIGSYQRSGSDKDAVTADDLIIAYKQLIARAHAHDLKIIGATLTPYEGAGYFGEPGEAIRQTVNAWIRTAGAFDGVIDFEAATRDPANSRRFKPAFDRGDHLHPNATGYAAMGDAVDLRLFGVR